MELHYLIVHPPVKHTGTRLDYTLIILELHSPLLHLYKNDLDKPSIFIMTHIYNLIVQ